MSISWYEKKLHQEKPPNPPLEPTLNLDPHLAIISSAAADPRAVRCHSKHGETRTKE
jgi:hypothetical protein